MTLSEFKAWFEGFSEGIEGAPTEAQFAKIKAKVASLPTHGPYTGIRGYAPVDPKSKGRSWTEELRPLYELGRAEAAN